MDPCIACGTCLTTIQSLVAVARNTSSTSLVASTFLSVCGATYDAAICNRAALLATSGNNAGRAAVLCAALGSCSTTNPCANLTVPSLASNTTLLSGALDLCAAEGVSGGLPTALPSNATVNGSCLSNSNCTSGQLCSIPASNASRQCTCENGQDVCRPLGTCVDFCSLNSTANQLTLLNRGATVCDPTNSTGQCAADEQCTAVSQCVLYSCNATSQRIVQTACSGRCAVTELKLSSAVLADNGRSITVDLSAPAVALTRVPCSAIFDTASARKLGTGALCTAAFRTLTVSMTSSATLRVNELLVLAANTALVGLIRDSPFVGNVTVTTCSFCAAPTAVITGPTVVVAPCSSSSNTSALLSAAASLPPSFDASRSSDASGRSTWDNVTWALLPGAFNEEMRTLLQAVVNRANNNTDLRKRLVLSLTADDVFSLRSGPTYRLQVTVTSWLGTSANTSFSFTKVAAVASPSVSITGPAEQTFRISSGVRLAAEAGRVCRGQTVDWRWELPGGWSAPVQNNQRLNVPGPVVATHGQTFTVEVRGSFNGSEEVSIDTVSLTAIGAAPVAVLTGPNGDVTDDVAIVLNATASYDPDSPLTPLSFSWTCRRDDFPAPCFSDSNQGDTSVPSVWTLPAGLLTNGKTHVFTVVVSKADGVLTASASVRFQPRSAADKFPRGALTRLCAGSCSGPHLTTRRLTLLLELADGFSGSNVTFTCDQIPTLAAVAPDNDRSLPANVVRLNIPSALLPTTQPSITIVASLSYQGLSGAASVVVPLDSPPACGYDAVNASACFSVSLAEGKDTFPTAVATIRADGITDGQDSQLRYEFGIGDPASGSVQQLGTATSASILGLRNGTVKVYGCAIDSMGSRTCGSGQVTVQPPSDSFNASDALLSGDVDSLLTGSDTDALVQAALQVTLLLEMLSGGGSGSSANISDEVAAAMSATSGKLLTGLMANVNNMDGDQATQVASTLSNMAKSSSGALSDSVKSQFTDAASDLVDAAVGTDSTTLESTFVNQICTMFGVSKPGSSSTSGRRRLLQQTQIQSWFDTVLSSSSTLSSGMADQATPGGDGVTSGGNGVNIAVVAVQVVGSSGTATATAGPGTSSSSSSSSSGSGSGSGSRRMSRRLQEQRRQLQATSAATDATAVLNLSGAVATGASGYALGLVYLSDSAESVVTALGSSLPSTVMLRSGIVQLSWAATSSATGSPPTLGGANTITLTIPATSYDATKVGTCVSYNATISTISGNLTGLTIGSSPATFVSYDSTTGLVTCTVTAVGAYVVGQGPESVNVGGTPVVTSPPPPPALPPPGNQQSAPSPSPVIADDDDDGLSGGQIAGIVIGCVAFVALVAVVVFVVMYRRRSRQHVAAAPANRGGGDAVPVAEAWQSHSRPASPMAITVAASAASTAAAPAGDVESAPAEPEAATEAAAEESAADADANVPVIVASQFAAAEAVAAPVPTAWATRFSGGGDGAIAGGDSGNSADSTPVEAVRRTNRAWPRQEPALPNAPGPQP